MVVDQLTINESHDVASPIPINNYLRVALVGTPNCGKTALFNLLTGARQKVANYAGVTIERKLGKCVLPDGKKIEVLDLPGAYSLTTKTGEEAITRDVCNGQYRNECAPDFIVCVVDATNLQLHLRFALEVAQLGKPMLLALNVSDAAEKQGIIIDEAKLSEALNMPVVKTIAVRKNGAKNLISSLAQQLSQQQSVNAEKKLFNSVDNTNEAENFLDLHQRVKSILSKAVVFPKDHTNWDERVDRIVLHPVFGPIILLSSLLLMFQAVFSWAEPFKDGIETLVNEAGTYITSIFPSGILKDLLQQGIIAGLGTVLAFLPQILVLFFFILVLEESGYLPRAAFLLDRIMIACGLSGRSFIPLLSSFACAIPGVMATRTIPDYRDRLVTILVAPLATCSARLPIYTLLIGAFIPNNTIWGVFNLPGLVLFALYFSGVFSICMVALVIKLTIKRSQPAALLLELPAYRLPRIKDIAIALFERARIFLRRVSGLIVALTVILWLLVSFPKAPVNALLPAIDYSFAGKLGHWIEPIFTPLGFNWQIAIALIPAFAAREVVVSALATVYAVAANSEEAIVNQLSTIISHSWSLPTALSLLIWFVFAPQCISMLAVIRRETNSVLVMLGAAFYLLVLAYLASFITFQLATIYLN